MAITLEDFIKIWQRKYPDASASKPYLKQDIREIYFENKAYLTEEGTKTEDAERIINVFAAGYMARMKHEPAHVH